MTNDRLKIEQLAMDMWEAGSALREMDNRIGKLQNALQEIIKSNNLEEIKNIAKEAIK